MNSKTEKNLWRFRGNADEELAAERVEPNLFSDLIGADPEVGKVVRCGEDREGAESDIDIEVASDDLVEVELDDGLKLYLSASSFEELVKPRASRAGGGDIKTIPQSFTIGSQQTRGLGGFVLKAFRVLNLTGEIAEYSAEKIAEKLEQQLFGGSGGLIKWDSADASWNNTDSAPDNGRPLLLFLHGTASSTEGSFKHLWEENSEDWKRLCRDYEDNIFAFEHPSLSKSPIENAINLLKRLPDNATLHLVSHSRGGLVGELLCHGQLLNQQNPFSDDDFQFFDEGEGFQAGQLRTLGELLQNKNLNIERFLRVACPARGTTLASERLDVYLSGVLNLVGLVTGLKSSLVYGFLQALTLAVAKQRTKPQSLPGLEAMMPESPFIAMLNRPGKTSASHLAVIKGDIEPSGILLRIGLLMVDSFYRADHDLVVNTDSMSGGIKRLEWGALSDEGSQVNHFSYFKNAKTRTGMVDALLSSELPPAFELPLHSRYIRSWESSRGAGPDSPIAFVLPGISGTHLEVDGKRIWLDPGEIFKGNMRKLDINMNPTIDARPVIAKYYDDLMRFLGKTHRVIPFPYDWRNSILDASDRFAGVLAEELESSTQPIHLFAHSMGGLVVRGLIANHPALWQAVTSRKGSRLLMLGTPNSGSYSIFRLLAGQDKLSAMLDLVDRKHDENELLKLLSRFPGILELLPIHGAIDAYTSDIWKQLESALKKQAGFFGGDPLSDFNQPTPWTHPPQEALDAARHTWDKLNSVVLDPRCTAYIAGRADSTPVEMKIKANGKIKFFDTPMGDGRVPWQHGIPKDIPCWYVNAAHGDLANHEAAFAGLLEIANSGDTRLLSKTRPVTRAMIESLEIPKDSIEFYPTGNDITNAFTGSEPWRRRAQIELEPIINISVAHGNLRFAKAPLMAGHYVADAIVSAEKAMDKRLDGRLQQRHDLGLYPGRLHSSLVVLDKDLAGQAIGAIIVGLGQVGALSAGDLSDTIRRGLMEYALACSESPRLNDQPLSISSLLIGSGEGGLTLPDVIAAILDGLIAANRALAGNGTQINQTIRHFQFIELYEDTAAYAQRTLLRLGDNPRYRKLINVKPALEQNINGGYRRIAHMEDESWWERIQISGTQEEIKFLYLTNRARAEGHLVATQRRLVDQILAQATKSSSIDRKLSHTLFELLLPQEFKQRASDRRNMMLILDKKSARYPWELLEYIDDEGNPQAPSTSAGMIRQLAVDDDNYTTTPDMISNRKALIIGDPLSDAPELPGAQQEAKQVGKIISDHEFDSDTLIRPEGLQVITELMTGKFQLIHLAAHGVYNYKTDKDAEPVSGMLLGNGLFLTSAEIDRLSSVPELVFINCCHLGRISGQPQEYVQSRHKLAANLATSLIQKGVKAVIAAGWVVDDQAATLFAQQFYTAMFDGDDFGEAVRGARDVIRRRYLNCNTWGAYQCYGDPHYRLQSAASRKKFRSKSIRFVCEQEVIIALQNLSSDVISATDGEVEGLKRKLEEINKQSTQWHDGAKVQVGFGKAYAELDLFPNAISAYTRASNHEISDISIRAIEQLCNLQARYAVDLHNQQKSQQAEELIDEAIKRLESIHDALAPSVERLALLGSTYKRQAMTISSGFITPLSNMFDNYRKADELALEKKGSVYCYTRLNRLTAQLLLSIHSRSKKYANLDKFDTQLHEAESATESFLLHGENFWDAIALTDCELIRALYENNLQRDAERILEHYREQKKRMGSPRQFRSVLENLRFLQQLLKTKRAGDAKLIEGIHSGLI